MQKRMLNELSEKKAINDINSSQVNLNTTTNVIKNNQQMTFGDEFLEKSGIRFGEDYRRQLLEQNNSTSFNQINNKRYQTEEIADIDSVRSKINNNSSQIPQKQYQKSGYVRNGQSNQAQLQKNINILGKNNSDENQLAQSESSQNLEDQINIQQINNIYNEKKEIDSGNDFRVYDLSIQNKNMPTININSEYLIGSKKNQFASELLNPSVNTSENRKLLWQKNFFVIAAYIAKFKYHLKKQLIFRNPDLLQKNQIQIIDDKGAKGIEEMDQSALKNSHKKQLKSYSKYKTIRKLKKRYLLTKKQLKIIWKPAHQFILKCMILCKVALSSLDIPLFFPTNPFIIAWDIINTLLIFIQTLYISFNFSYGSYLYIYYLELASQIVFITNIFVQCNLSYYEKGIQINQRKLILKHFFQKLFFSEVLALIGLFMPNGDPFQFLFFFKFPQFHNVVNKYKENNQFNIKINLIFNITILLTEIIQFGHFLCCAWYILGKYNYHNSKDNLSWAQGMDLQNTKSMYIVSLYFCAISITTIGYGDVVAKNDNERIFVIFMSLTSTGVLGYTINRMNNILDEYYKLNNQFRTQLSDINFYMNQREVSQIIQNRARNYLEYVYKEGYVNSEKISKSLQSLSSNIIEAIQEDIFYKSLKKIEIFESNFSRGFLQRLALKVKENNYAPDEEIIKRSQVKDPVIYFIVKGEVEIFVDSSQDKYSGADQVKSYCILEKDTVFGLGEFLVQEQVPTYSARSKGISRIQSLTFQDFFETIKEFPKDREIYQNIKDKLIQHNNYQECKLYCYSCKSSRHLVGKCPYVQYEPNKLKIYNSYLKTVKDKHLSFKRKQMDKNKFNTLANQGLVEEGMIKFLEQNNLIEWVSDESRDEGDKQDDQINEKKTEKELIKLQSLEKDDQEEIERKNFELKKKQLLKKKKSRDNQSAKSSNYKQGQINSPFMKESKPIINEVIQLDLKESQNKLEVRDEKFKLTTKFSDLLKDVSSGDLSFYLTKNEEMNQIEKQQQEEKIHQDAINKIKRLQIFTQKSPQTISQFTNYFQDEGAQQIPKLEQDEQTSFSTAYNILHLLSKQATSKMEQLQPCTISNQPQKIQNNSIATPKVNQQPTTPTKRRMSLSPKQNHKKQAQGNQNYQNSSNNQEVQNVLNQINDLLKKSQQVHIDQKKITEFQNNGKIQTGELTYQHQLNKQSDDFEIIREFNYYFIHNNISNIIKKLYENQPKQLRQSRFSNIQKIKKSKTVKLNINKSTTKKLNL
ncbi:hypothetical protein ABPG74_009784 [Tetrahymena malaccensis]